MKILLKEIMEKKNLSLRQVELLTGVSKSQLSNIITGNSIPRLDTLELIAKGLKVHMSDLYESEYK